MTIFLSRRPNLDPEPWYAETADGVPMRASEQWRLKPYLGVYDPRPVGPEGQVFEPTRDPMPWANEDGIRGNAYAVQDVLDMGWAWSPRRDEYDTPVNRVLEAFRSAQVAPQNRWLTVAQIAAGWLQAPGFFMKNATPTEIDHARKVLQRLANLTTKED